MVLGAIVGAGLATASAYLLHMRILEQMQARLELEELNRRRWVKRAKRIARLHNGNRQDVASNSHSQANAVAAADGCHALNSSVSPIPSNVDNEDSFIAINNMPTWLPRVQTHGDGTCININFDLISFSVCKNKSSDPFLLKWQLKTILRSVYP